MEIKQNETKHQTKAQTTWQKKNTKTQQLNTEPRIPKQNITTYVPRNSSKTCGLLSHCQSTRVEPEQCYAAGSPSSGSRRRRWWPGWDVLGTQERTERLGTWARHCLGTARGRDIARQHGLDNTTRPDNTFAFSTSCHSGWSIKPKGCDMVQVSIPLISSQCCCATGALWTPL